MADTALHRIKRPVGRHTGRASVSPVGSGARECRSARESTPTEVGHSNTYNDLLPSDRGYWEGGRAALAEQ